MARKCKAPVTGGHNAATCGTKSPTVVDELRGIDPMEKLEIDGGALMIFGVGSIFLIPGPWAAAGLVVAGLGFFLFAFPKLGE